MKKFFCVINKWQTSIIKDSEGNFHSYLPDLGLGSASKIVLVNTETECRFLASHALASLKENSPKIYEDIDRKIGIYMIDVETMSFQHLGNQI